MNSDALLLAFYFRRSVTINRTFIAPYRANTTAEYFRSRIYAVSNAMSLGNKPLLPFDDKDIFPHVCICGNIFSSDGAYLQRYCKHCLGKKTGRDPWEISNFFDVFSATFKLAIPQLVHLYYAAAINLESRRLQCKSTH